MRSLALLILTAFVVSCGTETDPATQAAATTDAAPHASADSSTLADTAVAMGPDAGAPTDLGLDPDLALPEPAPVDSSPLDVMGRPAKVVLPDDYDPARTYPLVVLLHGYSASGDIQDLYFGVGVRSTERQFILVKPNGTANPESKRFWNAFWCCDFYAQDVDDVAYISALIDDAKARFSVDAQRVYLLGHSNGGFMSYRMACEIDGIAALASLAGSAELDEADCAATAAPLGVLQIHGTLDGTIPYDGWPGRYPGARELMERWAARNGCGAEPVAGEALDLEANLPGEDTSTLAWEACAGGTSVALWTIEAGGHIPNFQPAFIERTLDFLFAHVRP